MTRFWVYSGDRPSNGAKELSTNEQFLRLRPERFFKLRSSDIVINWGTTADLKLPVDCKLLNAPKRVALATNKRSAFETFEVSEVKCVKFTTLRDTAQQWADDDKVVVVRNKLTGHSGDGIVIIEKSGEVPEAPLYTQYIFKEKEFRVHVVCGKVVDTAQKIKDPDREVTNWKVRSHENGFIFARNNISPSPPRDGLALEAVEALGLDFGAVDIIEDKKGIYYVLEVNTAPGLEGQTVNSYVEAFSGSQSNA